MSFVLGPRSLQRLQGVHPDLVKVVEHAIKNSPVDFMVVEGLRTLARQKELVAAGASKTLNSRHLTGHAVDLAPVVAGEVRWDWPLYKTLAPVIKASAKKLGVPIEWGGDWITFKDGPHWQLSFKTYK